MEPAMYWRRGNNRKRRVDKNCHRQHDRAKPVELVMFDSHRICPRHERSNPFLLRRRRMKQACRRKFRLVYQENHTRDKPTPRREVFPPPDSNPLAIEHW
jgi:hypothetical protein